MAFVTADFSENFLDMVVGKALKSRYFQAMEAW